MRIPIWILGFVCAVQAQTGLETTTGECVCNPNEPCPTDKYRKSNPCWRTGFEEGTKECTKSCDEAAAKAKTACEDEIKKALEKCRADSEDALQKLKGQCAADVEEEKRRCQTKIDDEVRKALGKCRADSDDALQKLKGQCAVDVEEEKRRCQTKVNDAVKEAVAIEKAKCQESEDALQQEKRRSRQLQELLRKRTNTGAYKVIDPNTFPHYYFADVGNFPDSYVLERLPVPRVKNWTDYDSAAREGFEFPGGAPGTSANSEGLYNVQHIGYEGRRKFPRNDDRCLWGLDNLTIIAQPITFDMHIDFGTRGYSSQTCTVPPDAVVLAYAHVLTGDVNGVTIRSSDNSPMKLWRFSLVGRGGIRQRDPLGSTFIIRCGHQEKRIELPSEIHTVEQGTIWTFDRINMDFGPSTDESRLNCNFNWQEVQYLDGASVTVTHFDFIK